MNLATKLIQKSIEAFILSIEIYNKPTIKYRVEGFSFFICNAWELMLKAHMINSVGENSIYYKEDSSRTLNLESCIKRVFTNSKDPLRLNLEKIIELRNTSTHLIVEEYEMIYIPLFQACVYNFDDKILQFHGIRINEHISQGFLNLTLAPDIFSEEAIKTKYPPQIAEKLLFENDAITLFSNINNTKFAISIMHQYYITKDASQASATIKIDSSAHNTGKIIKQLQDPNSIYPHTRNSCLDVICKRIMKDKISFNTCTASKNFNSHHFNLMVNYFDIKNNINFSYKNEVHRGLWQYSQKAIEFILSEIKKDPSNIIQRIKNSLKD